MTLESQRVAEPASERPVECAVVAAISARGEQNHDHLCTYETWATEADLLIRCRLPAHDVEVMFPAAAEGHRVRIGQSVGVGKTTMASIPLTGAGSRVTAPLLVRTS